MDAFQQPAPQFTSLELRRTLGAFATGVTVVTTCGPAGLYGITANSFTSVSLNPALVLVCLNLEGPGRAVIADNGVFAVNVLTAEQELVGRHFAQRDRPRGPDAFRGIDHRVAATGSPILSGSAHLDCGLVGTYPAGDHAIVIGEVLDVGCHSEAAPLLFHAGRFRALAESLAA